MGRPKLITASALRHQDTQGGHLAAQNCMAIEDCIGRGRALGEDCAAALAPQGACDSGGGETDARLAAALAKPLWARLQVSGEAV